MIGSKRIMKIHTQITEVRCVAREKLCVPPKFLQLPHPPPPPPSRRKYIAGHKLFCLYFSLELKQEYDVVVVYAVYVVDVPVPCKVHTDR